MNQRCPAHLALATLITLAAAAAQAGVSPQEAARLKAELTPFGAEKAGNKEGTIPAWTGGLTTPQPGFKNGGRRPDPFADEKPLLTITAANAAQHADKLSDGALAMLKKYPQSFRINIYKTHRTAAAPQWVYDNTFKNATSARFENGMLKGAFGGIPFPIPKDGKEAITNNELHWRAPAAQADLRGYMGTGEGRIILSVHGIADYQMPYYLQGAEDKFEGAHWMTRVVNIGPPIRAGEAITGRQNLDFDKTNTWVYLTGQRRVRKLPASCCDTPLPASGGVASFDEREVFSGRHDRFDWKLVGKKELYIPYNSNRLLVPTKDSDVVLPHHLNPDHLRWELHRVWVIEATLKPGARHQSPRSRYYLDEDTWVAVLGDRWDAKGQHWKMLWSIPIAMPDIPATAPAAIWGFNDLISGAWYVSGIVNERPQHYKVVPPRDDAFFTPEAMAGALMR